MIQLPSPEPLLDSQIREKAHELFKEFIRVVGDEHVRKVGIDFDEAYEAVIYPKYEIILVKDEYLGCDDDGCAILGQFLSRKNVALIDKTLFDTSDPRRVFTTIHEVVGHGVLQGKFLRENSSKYPKLYDTDDSMNLRENTFEGQATTMATNFITPAPYVFFLFKKLFRTNKKIHYTGPAVYSLYFNGKDYRVKVSSPLELAWQIAQRIKHYFWGLSTETITYRVLEVAINQNGYNNKDFGLYKATQRIGNVIKRNNS